MEYFIYLLEVKSEYECDREREREKHAWFLDEVDVFSAQIINGWMIVVDVAKTKPFFRQNRSQPSSGF